MSEKLTWKVRMATLGKAPIEVEAEDATAAVNAVVTAYARRAGDTVESMARRLDKIAEVWTGKGAPMRISVLAACPPEPVATSLETEVAEGIAEALAAPEDTADRFDM